MTEFFPGSQRLLKGANLPLLVQGFRVFLGNNRDGQSLPPIVVCAWSGRWDTKPPVVKRHQWSSGWGLFGKEAIAGNVKTRLTRRGGKKAHHHWIPSGKKISRDKMFEMLGRCRKDCRGGESEEQRPRATGWSEAHRCCRLSQLPCCCVSVAARCTSFPPPAKRSLQFVC